MHKIGDIVDVRSDGSYIYMSTDGIKNLDNSIDLAEAQREDEARLPHCKPCGNDLPH